MHVTDFEKDNVRKTQKEAHWSAFKPISVVYCTPDCTRGVFGMVCNQAVGFMRIWSRGWDLNPQPPLYESGALPLSYLGKR
jgi:hypothetical protein